MDSGWGRAGRGEAQAGICAESKRMGREEGKHPRGRAELDQRVLEV